MFLYKITNRINGKGYVGITKMSVARRFSRHANDKKEPTTLIGKAIRKYGRENFIVETLAVAESWEELLCLEREAIDSHGTFAGNGGHGYNATLGGEGVLGVRFSEEERKQISLRNTGYRHTPEAIERIRQASTGRQFSMERSIKISRALTGKKMSPEAVAKSRAWRAERVAVFSPEARLKIGAARRGKKMSQEFCEKMRLVAIEREKDPARKLAMKGFEKPIWLDGKVWPSRRFAMSALGKCSYYVSSRLKSGEAYYIRRP
jgi:group I intron endonuclease